MRFTQYIVDGIDAHGIVWESKAWGISVGHGVSIDCESRSVSVGLATDFNPHLGGNETTYWSYRFTGRGWRKRMIKFVQFCLMLHEWGLAPERVEQIPV